MLHGGFGTLTFFGIASRSAKNNITTQQIATKERVSVHTQTYVSGYGAYARTHTRETARTSTPTAWEDTYTCSSRYYDANGDFCGSSQSSGTDKELHTIYYDANGCRCGTSTSGLNGYFETTYYNTDGRPCGTSTGRGYDTTYYLPDGREWDTSKSDSSGNTTYATPQQLEQARTERERARQEEAARQWATEQERRERYERERPAREALEKTEREKAALKAHERRKQIVTNRERVEIQSLKEHYSSSASFFNASSGVFASNNHAVILKKLENRARRNPNGASNCTIRHFGLKESEQERDTSYWAVTYSALKDGTETSMLEKIENLSSWFSVTQKKAAWDIERCIKEEKSL